MREDAILSRSPWSAACVPAMGKERSTLSRPVRPSSSISLLSSLQRFPLGRRSWTPGRGRFQAGKKLLVSICFDAVAHGDQKEGALACGVRGEEEGYIVVVESETSRAQSLGIGGQIKLAADDAGFQLRRAIAAIAHPSQNRAQVREEEDVHGSIGR